MELISTLNRRLEDRWGRAYNDKPNYRIVFSDEQLEKRFDEWTDRTTEGIYLRTVREVREVPKYPWIKGKFVLEKQFEVPLLNREEVLAQVSYEPIYIFEDVSGNPVAPVWLAIEMILNNLHSVMETGKYYQDPDIVDPKIAKEVREQKITEMMNALWPNETEVGDALRYREGIVVPSSFVGNSAKKES